MAVHQRLAGRAHRAGRERRAPWQAVLPADGADPARPRAEQPGPHAERLTAARLHQAATARPARWRAALRSGGIESAQPKAERPARHEERSRAARRRPAEGQHAAVSEPSARPAGAAVSGELREPRWETAQRGARQAPHAASPGARAADAPPAARHAVEVRAWRAAVPEGRLARAAPAAGAELAAGREPSVRPVVPGRAGRTGHPAAVGAVARVDHRLRRQEPVRPGIRPRRRPARLAKGRGPAGRSRPATSVSCASLFPSFCFNVRVSGPSWPEPPMKRKRQESGSGSLG